MDKFLDLIHLVRYLDGDASVEDKIAEIKNARDNGTVSVDEAVDLVLEFDLVRIPSEEVRA